MEKPTKSPAPRRYQAVWDKIISNPEKPVKVGVTKKELLKRVRKAVWKEKDLCQRKNPSSGTFLKSLYRLTAMIDEDALTITFKLEPTIHLDNL